MIVVLEVKIYINGEDWIISIYKYQMEYDKFINEVIPICRSVGVVENHYKFIFTKWKLNDDAFISLIRLRDKYDLTFAYTRNKW